jgi:hypothetical protein
MFESELSYSKEYDKQLHSKIKTRHSIMSFVDMKIAFENPNERLKGEVRSKLLKTGSPLWVFLDTLRDKLVEKYGYLVGPMRMGYHIELIKNVDGMSNQEISDMSVTRSKFLEGKVIQVPVDVRNLTWMGKALVVTTPYVEGYGPTHITVAFFPGGRP